MTIAGDEQVRVAVAGSTGYLGIQAVALVQRHPRLRLVEVSGRSHAGRSYASAVPGSDLDLTVTGEVDPAGADVVIAALPHGVAASHAEAWLAAGAVVVDLSADFRLADDAGWQRWYGGEHPAPGLRAEAAYALPELFASVPGQRLLAMPGCYPTAALLAVAPALAAGLVEPEVIVDAKSGVSGAGRSATPGTQYAEVNESVHAYSVGGHRHKAEMLQALARLAGGAVEVTFVPHLVPMTRGILATAYLRPRSGVTAGEILGCYAAVGATHPCLRVDSAPPSTKSVAGTNIAALHAGWQDGRVVVTCAIDNLIKGGAGQAIQALNLSMGWPETSGLPLTTAWP